jgi:hypothetical protein
LELIFNFLVPKNKLVEYLVVGGGGGSTNAAWNGGGGGATGNTNIASGSNYIITVGNGGDPSSTSTQNGQPSSITFNQTIIAQANGGYANIGMMRGISSNSFSGGDTDSEGEAGGGGAGCDGNGGYSSGLTPGSGGYGILYNITGTMV